MTIWTPLNLNGAKRAKQVRRKTKAPEIGKQRCSKNGRTRQSRICALLLWAGCISAPPKTCPRNPDHIETQLIHEATIAGSGAISTTLLYLRILNRFLVLSYSAHYFCFLKYFSRYFSACCLLWLMLCAQLAPEGCLWLLSFITFWRPRS